MKVGLTRLNWRQVEVATRPILHPTLTSLARSSSTQYQILRAGADGEYTCRLTTISKVCGVIEGSYSTSSASDSSGVETRKPAGVKVLETYPPYSDLGLVTRIRHCLRRSGNEDTNGPEVVRGRLVGGGAAAGTGTILLAAKDTQYTAACDSVEAWTDLGEAISRSFGGEYVDSIARWSSTQSF